MNSKFFRILHTLFSKDFKAFLYSTIFVQIDILFLFLSPGLFYSTDVLWQQFSNKTNFINLKTTNKNNFDPFYLTESFFTLSIAYYEIMFCRFGKYNYLIKK